MNNPFRTLEEYELFLYTLANNSSVIESSTVTCVREGGTLARIVGEISFAFEFRLVVRERILHTRTSVTIGRYGYEIWQGATKLFWYDSQPHPDDSKLASTHPHHKHVPPDIKHNRVPAPEMSFTRPNLPVLIREIEILIQKAQDENKESRQED